MIVDLCKQQSAASRSAFVLRSRVFLAACAVVALLPGGALAATDASIDPEQAMAGFDAWVENVMKDWKVPGLGVAVIHDRKLLFAKGYGYRDLDNSIKADGDTLFAIGSNSKSFTAMLLAILEDDGALEWQAPVRDVIHEFRMQDPVATDQMTAVDLLSHRSGLPRHDLAWYGSELSRQELLERLQHLEPTASFRERFQYQNLMYMTAGVLAERIAGKTWEELVDERILGPLGMTRSNFSVLDMQSDSNHSRPYTHPPDGEIIEIPFRNIDAIGPAGSINSSPREMAQYVLMHLREGALGEGEDAERILSATNAAMMTSPQMVMTGPIAARFQDPELGTPSYGLGLMISSYRGHEHVFHGGGIDGFISAMEWLPDSGIGVVVLSNTNGSGLAPRIVTYGAFDRLLGLEPVDWNQRLLDRQAEARKQADAQREQASDARHPDTAPSHALEDYAGSYRHPAYESAQIAFADTQLRLTFGAFEVPLDHYHYDVFEVPADLEGPAAAFAGTKVQFFYDKDGLVDRVAIPLEPTGDDIVFERVAGDELEDPEFLARLTGDYALGEMTATVALEGTRLTLSVPGQPLYRLAPASGTSFAIEGLDGFRVEFVLGDEEAAEAMISHQPNGSFRAERKP